MKLFFFLLGFTMLCRAQDQAPDWMLEGRAAWQARDSQAEWVFRDQLWIGGGWFQSYEEPPRDLWASGDGREWKLIEKNAPWQHSDLPMNITFKDRMWIMGGWHKGRLPGHSASNQVWSSGDGLKWDQVTAAAGWSPRLAAGLVEFHGRLWMLGGTENYYFGDEKSLKNDVWSSADGREWKLETANAGWSPRAYHQAVVLNDRMYVLGGGNYVPAYHAKNDVWSSGDGVNWTRETASAPWEPRMWFSAAAYRGRLWVLGGWSKEKDNFGDVWHSADGKDWQRLETTTCWKARHEHSVFVFKDKLWLAGGHARPLSNEVWSLHLPPDWKPMTSTASLPVLTLPVRVHLMQSETMPAMHTTLVEPDIRRIFGKVNKVWSQAGIQFEIESIGPTTAVPAPPEMRLKPEFDRVHSMIPKQRLSALAIDVCYVKEVRPNGFYYGEPIVVKDTAKLQEVAGGLDEPLPRVTSHEIGHALGLKHRQDKTNLMQSGTTGFSLNEAEIAAARATAAEYLVRQRKGNAAGKP